MSFQSHVTAPKAATAHCRIALMLLVLVTVRPATAAEFVGIVHARHHLNLSVSVPGLVAQRAVEPGARVEVRQLLIGLDDRQQRLESQRRQAILDDRSELDSSRERLTIVEPLAADAARLLGTSAAISREELARTQLDLISTRGRVAQLEAQKERERIELALVDYELASRQLQAPVAGIVTKVNVDVGEWARPGDVLVELVDTAELHLRVNLPLAATRRLKIGQALTLKFDPGLGLQPVQGRVGFVAAAVDAASGLTEVRIVFGNPGGRISPGVKGSVDIDAGASR